MRRNVPETEFILNYTEQQDIINLLLNKGAKCVPHIDYDECKYKETDSPSEILSLIESRKTSGPFHFLCKSYTKHRLEMDSYNNEKGSKVYFIIQRYGGLRIFP